MATHRAALLKAIFSIAALVRRTTCAQLPNGPSIPMEYCATVNTADMEPLNAIWQSDGLCFGNCTNLKYALAIIQDHNCWCSNLVPNTADQKPLTDCQMPCPGFPSDYCGGDGLFGYMQVAGFNPTGTAPPANPSTTTPPSSSSSTVQPTTIVTLSETSSTVSSSSSAPNTTSGTSSHPPVLVTVTADGTIRTVTATPTPTHANNPALADNTGSAGLQAGAIVGIVVGVVGGLAVIAAFLWLWYSKRRRQNQDDTNGFASPTRGSGSPGVIGTPKAGEVSEIRYPGAADSQNKRRSHLMPVDPRLDPFATGLYVADQNLSRESFTSLQDNTDYSRRVHQPQRVLRPTNPDPDDD
ncbi:hypothetical protein N657DRAFT_282272 [Parathielavia appendiculata]|uniref:WSC domain-containing protein n=1 Tax=Parathielavia appendiculata TaxID=2587402 RepID=A0AAN6U6F9_9PEZI|nr:hypothetical protein N657DRAFT_282272 [Parathielavia appendiculata]